MGCIGECSGEDIRKPASESMEEYAGEDTIVYHKEDTRESVKEGVGGIVVSEHALRSVGTLLSPVRAPPPTTLPDGSLTT
ncbi:hypothetical protein PoB_006291700 [Plakobranchus ocellatus]|uniref:Uncharacterized protein n=1 Tax=Plakobranchus ocellatus TaxID=259542 RepID=A0AAV4CWX2_9GAST|nr:hypothetical protein PoB_006291700 [Plakobranchus ocellatus]